MQGTRWVCLLREVAAGFNLTNSAAGLEPPQAAEPPAPPPQSEWEALAEAEREAAAALLPPEYNLEDYPV